MMYLRVGERKGRGFAKDEKDCVGKVVDNEQERSTSRLVEDNE